MRVDAKCRFLPLLVIALAVGDLCAQETSKNAGGGTATSTQSTAAADSLSADASDQRPIPAAVSNVVAVDHANDRGDKIDVKWDLSPDDGLDDDAPAVSGYRIERSSDGGQSWVVLETVARGTRRFEDDKAVHAGTDYVYRVIVLGPGGEGEAAVTETAVRARVQMFDWSRFWFGTMLAVLCAAVIGFIYAARRGLTLRVRKIAGLEVVDEAVGRATEMGRTCIFVPGINDMNDIQTVAGITVLSRVARTAAEYDARVEVPTSRSLVMTAARDTVESSYLTAGRPEAFNDNQVYYVTDEQFGYVAYLAGKMVREKPAACFYMGAFYAESLVLAETGNSIGAIQVAGTAEPSQLPFFVAACDYTLIGEEFFAASAYLSGEPEQLGSLKGQDLGKIFAVALILLGCVLATIESAAPADGKIAQALHYLTESVLKSGGGE